MDEKNIELRLRAIYKELSNDFNFSGYLKIVISNRLRSCNGYCEVNSNRYFNTINKAKIVMSKALLDEFGWERFEKTFRHEVAHFANQILYNGRGHGESFKRLCRKFEGSMNTKMAGVRYADCADTKYIKTIKKWIYKCPCGFEKKMARRMNKRKRGSSNWRCGKCGITLDKWQEIRVA